LFFLLALIIVPSFGSGFLVLKFPTEAPGRVAGSQVGMPPFAIYLNEDDFGSLVSSQGQEITSQSITEKVYFTSFDGHIAVYNQVYQLSNTSPRSLRLRVRVPELSPQAPFTQGILVLQKGDRLYHSSLSKSAETGSTVLEVEDSSVFNGVPSVLIGDEMVGIFNQVPKQLYIPPLSRSSEEGVITQFVAIKQAVLYIPGAAKW